MDGWGWVRIGAVLGFLGVGLGAFGAHGLKDRLDTLGTAATYQTAVQYHLGHALALVTLGALAPRLGSGMSAFVGGMFLAGVLVFSGSLYVLSLTGIKWLGAVTPIGGLAFLAGWLALAFAQGKPTAAIQSDSPVSIESPAAHKAAGRGDAR